MFQKSAKSVSNEIKSSEFDEFSLSVIIVSSKTKSVQESVSSDKINKSSSFVVQAIFKLLILIYKNNIINKK
ncbi:hypothetical protein GW891_01005 [bacterium]|nr:hypothetical protein [bacterium]